MNPTNNYVVWIGVPCELSCLKLDAIKEEELEKTDSIKGERVYIISIPKLLFITIPTFFQCIGNYK